MTSKTVEWLDKWQDWHDLGGITVGEVKADLAAMEKEWDRQKGAAESWKDSYRECLARAEAAEAALKKLAAILLEEVTHD